MEPNKADKQDVSRPAHDARIEFSILIKRHLINISLYSNSRAYDNWHRELISLHNLTRKYIPTKINGELDGVCARVDNNLCNIGSDDDVKEGVALHNLELFLRKFTTKLYYYIQPLLMPVTTSEDEDMEVDGFFGERK